MLILHSDCVILSSILSLLSLDSLQTAFMMLTCHPLCNVDHITLQPGANVSVMEK